MSNCCVCYVEVEDSLRELTSCSCICKDCLKSFIKSRINEGKINSEGNIRCFCSFSSSCGNEITKELILKVLEEEKIEQSIFSNSESESLIEKYHRFHQNAIVASNPDLLWCVGV